MTATMQHPDVLLDTTRTEMLDAGLLHDVTAEARRLGFRHSVAITDEVWEDCVRWDEVAEARKPGATVEETQSRLRDLLWVALLAARRSCGSRAYFTLDRVPAWGGSTQMRPVTLTMTIAPGDDLRPVITVDMPGK